jgi:hypothetical protein
LKRDRHPEAKANDSTLEKLLAVCQLERAGGGKKSNGTRKYAAIFDSAEKP